MRNKNVETIKITAEVIDDGADPVLIFKKETKVTNHGVTDNMSFSKAFRTARDSYGGKGGEFTWKGKKYHTGTKSESSKKEEKKDVSDKV